MLPLREFIIKKSACWVLRCLYFLRRYELMYLYIWTHTHRHARTLWFLTRQLQEQRQTLMDLPPVNRYMNLNSIYRVNIFELAAHNEFIMDIHVQTY